MHNTDPSNTSPCLFQFLLLKATELPSLFIVTSDFFHFRLEFEMEQNRHKIIVGVDYGTTFTGKLPSKMIKEWTKRVKEQVMLALEERQSMISS